MRTDFDVLREALESIAKSYPTTDEGEWMQSEARGALDELADRERSRASGIAGYPREHQVTAVALVDLPLALVGGFDPLRQGFFSVYDDLRRESEARGFYTGQALQMKIEVEPYLRAERTPQPADQPADQP